MPVSRLIRALALATCFTLVLGCGQPATPTPAPVAPAEPATVETAPDSAVAFENPGATPVQASFPTAIPPTASPEGIITWTKKPSFSEWTLTAAGQLQDGYSLVDWREERAPAFAVYYKGHTEPLAVLLPDLPLGQMWETDQTVAPTFFEMAGPAFSIEAHSPLFGDTGGNLELHAFGYDSEGNQAVLAVITIR